MVEIQFRNQMKQGDMIEIIEGNFSGQYIELPKSSYLQYEDDEKIKNIVKLSNDCVEIIRFGTSSSKLTLKFNEDGAAHFNYPEMVMDLLTRVEWFEMKVTGFELAYLLLQPESEAVIGSYQLSYNWQ